MDLRPGRHRHRHRPRHAPPWPPRVRPATRTVSYDKLLLATGASPRRLNFPGSDHDEVLYLRTLADSDRLRAAFQPGTRVVVAGAGWIGLETTAAARHGRLPGDRARAAARRAARPARSRARRASSPTCTARMAWSSASASGRSSSAPAWSSPRAAPNCPADLLVVGIGAAPNDDAGRPRGTRGRQRRPDRRGAAHLGCEHLRRRRRRELVQPAARPPGPRRALGQRPERRPGRRPVHARPARRLRPGALLLQRPVRPRHGMRRPAHARHLRPGRLPR